MEYVTYDETGALTGAFIQDMQPEHEDCHIVANPAQRMNWVAYRANDARDGLDPLPPVAPPIVVPQEVTQRQGLRALFLAGVTEADIESFIGQIEDETERGLALIDFRSASTWSRTWPLVIAAGAALGLDLDALFIQAATL